MDAKHAVLLISITSLATGANSTLAQVGAGHTPPKTDEEMIANALAAAPAAVAQGAAVIAFDDKGNIRTLRQGTNQFTCIPDDPTNPANDPNCVDANGLEWVKAYVSKTEPPKGKVGFGYMLQGGTTQRRPVRHQATGRYGLDAGAAARHGVQLWRGNAGLSEAGGACGHDATLGDVGRVAL